MTIEFDKISKEYQKEVSKAIREQPSLQHKLVEFRETSGAYYNKIHNVLVQKQADYGPLNISLAPGGPINGLLVRMNDKMQRLINLTYGQQEPSNEAIRDSYEDLANYCIIALMVLDGKWEGVDGVE